MPRKRITRLALAERFWPKVRKGEDCWEWTGARARGKRRGHGRLGLLYAHRVSWELHFGPIPDDLCVCHHCDNPPCVNPAHLFLGSKSDNTLDMHAKGRGRGGPNQPNPKPRKPQEPPHAPRWADRRGEKNPSAKLTAALVSEIRRRYATGDESLSALGRAFGVDFTTIGLIVRRETWKETP